MSVNGDIIQQLLQQQELSPEEEVLLRTLLEADFNDNLQYTRPQNQEVSQRILAKLHIDIAAATTSKVATIRMRIFRLAVAASVAMLAAGVWWLAIRQKKSLPGVTAVAPIAPGCSGAVLTLANGTQLTLDSLGNGLVANEKGVSVLLHNNQLEYRKATATTETAWNLLTTPRSRQFQLMLPDGTKVWLNAASSIRYPVAFTGKERKVEITGEVFMEVAPQHAAPFIVSSGNMQLQVLGTAFNINAYKDEAAITATLTEGSVRVLLSHTTVQTAASLLLKPGQQAAISHQITLNPQADINAVLAWKNGQFSFEQANVAAVMRQIARWYDVDIKYEGTPPQREFHGGIGRDFTLQQVLEALEKTGVHCRLEGRTVIVEKSPD